MLSFKLQVGKIKTDQTTDKFIIICPKNKEDTLHILNLRV